MNEDTTILQRAKDAASAHKKKAVAGVSVATLAAAYAIFCTESHFQQHVQQERESRAEVWRLVQDLDNKLDNVCSNVIWLHATTVHTTRTN